MFRLAAFGGLVLTNETGSDVATQRRRLALLALLAVAHSRGLSRDRLLAFLWPESDADRARHSLEQLLYVLRRQVDEELFIGSDPIRLNPLTIASDVAAFEQALAAGNDEEAVALYGGPFLDGFHLGEGGDFDDWAEGERVRLAAAFAAALERLAAHASERGDSKRAVLLWRRLVALDRLSAPYVLGLLRSFAAAGDRAEALRLGASYEALVREELQLPPEPAVRAFVEGLRSTPAAHVPSDPAASMYAAPITDFSPEPAPLPVQTSSAGDQGAVDSTRSRGRRPALRSSILVAGAAAVTVIVGWGASEATRSRREERVDGNRVLLTPFRVTGDSALAHLAGTVPTLLTAWLTGEGGPLAIDAFSAPRSAPGSAPTEGGDPSESELLQRARDVGAGRVLLGEAVLTGPGRLELRARLVSSAGDGGGVRASVTGPTDSLTVLVDRLAAQLLALDAGESPQRMASLEGRSPEALSTFLEGRAAHRQGRDASARALFARALEYDSTFALAALELALATGQVFRRTRLTTDSTRRNLGVSLTGDLQAESDVDLWVRAIELAWRGRDQLGSGDAALLLALRIDYPEKRYARDVLSAWEGAVRAAPNQAEAHFFLGYVLLHQGLAMGLADSRARAASSFRHAFELDSAYLSPLTGLIEIAAYERDAAALRRWQALYLARDSVGAGADYVRWLVAAALKDGRALRRMRSRFPALDLNTLARIQRISQLSGLALEDARRADSITLGRTNVREQRWVALYRSTALQLNTGRPDEALRLMGLKRDLDPVPELGQGYAVKYALLWEGDPAAGADAADTLAAELERAPSADVIASVTLWRLWHGDTTGAAAGIARLRREGGQPADMLDALLADVAHRPDAAATLARLDSLALRGCCDQPLFINLVSARLHERAGDLPAALAAVRRGRWFFPGEYLSTYLREEGRLAALVADTAGAIRAYGQYLELRSDPEPGRQPAVDTVRANLVRLDRGRPR